MARAKLEYDQRFYDEQAFRSGGSAEVVVPLLNDLLHPTSVLDVGCGIGAWLAEWERQGVADVTGLDGGYVDPLALRIDPSRFTAANLEEGFDLGRRFDLVECIEVAEHLDASRADAFVASLCQHADTVLFGAAIPGQGGTHHVNEQWPSYWVPKFASRGYQVYDPLRPQIWADQRVQVWHRQNLLLFSRELQCPNPGPVLDVVHPDLWMSGEGVWGRRMVRVVPGGVWTVVRGLRRAARLARPATR